MTLHHVEHEEKVLLERDESSSISYLPLGSIVELYDEEIEQGKCELEEVIAEIKAIMMQLHEQQLRIHDRREVMAIRLGADEHEIVVTPSAKEKLIEEQLRCQLNDLNVARSRMEESIELSRVNKIRHDEEINRRLFTAAVRSSY